MWGDGRVDGGCWRLGIGGICRYGGDALLAFVSPPSPIPPCLSEGLAQAEGGVGVISSVVTQVWNTRSPWHFPLPRYTHPLSLQERQETI